MQYGMSEYRVFFHTQLGEINKASSSEGVNHINQDQQYDGGVHNSLVIHAILTMTYVPSSTPYVCPTRPSSTVPPSSAHRQVQ